MPITPSRVFTTVAVCLLAFPSAVRAQEGSTNFARNGVYVGATGVPNFTFDGITFDGASVYQKIGGDEFIILPKLEPKSTFRAIGGFRLDRGSFEVGYERTTHAGTFMGGSGEAIFKALNFDERIYLLTRGRVQPYGLLGLSMPWLTIKDGSAVGEQVGDGSFRGFGVNTEAGVTVYPHSRVGISAGYRYRVMWFTGAKGVSQTVYILRPRFRETAGNMSFSIFLTF